MSRSNMKAAWNIAQALQNAVKAEPWLGIGVMYLLTPAQWNALRSGDVFVELHQVVSSMARRRFQGTPGGMHAADDATSETITRLATREFLHGYDPAKGPPKRYMLGVAWRYLLASRRSLSTQLRREGAARVMPEPASVSDHTDTDEQAAMLRILWELIEALPPNQRDAVKKVYSGDGEASRGNLDERRWRCRGLKSIREQLRRLGKLH